MSPPENLRDVYRILQNLDNGQLHVIGQIKEIKQDIEMGKRDRAEMKQMLMKLDDPDVGRVARAEAQIKVLQRAVDLFSKLRDRGAGVIAGAVIVLIFVAVGVVEGLKKLSALLLH